MPLPNFLIIGTTKGGTTSLYQYFRAHPEVYMSPVKEPRYFAFDHTNPEHQAGVPHRYPITSMEEYLALFDDVKGEKAIGEASPMYLNSPIASARIKSCIPDVKLVVSLRNPVDRAYSHYLMYHREGNIKSSFIDAFRDLERVDSYSQHCVRTSLYYEKLRRYYDIFDRDQIKVVFLEDLMDAPLSVLRELFRYIDVEETFVPEVSKVHNPGGSPKNRTLYSIVRYGFLPRSLYYRISATLKPVVPRIIVELRRKLMQRNLERPPQLTPEIREEVTDFYREDIARTQELIQKDLGCWLQND